MTVKFQSNLKNWMARRRVLTLLSCSTALSLSVAVITPVLAQTPPDAPPRGPERMQWKQKLNLTPEQQSQMARIRQSTRQQIDNILTAEQKAKLQAAQQNRSNRREAFRTLNLTTEQRTQMRTILQSSRQQMDAILTPEQRQQLQQMRRSKRSTPGQLPPQNPAQ